jgi:hypothetical protein
VRHTIEATEPFHGKSHRALALAGIGNRANGYCHTARQLARCYFKPVAVDIHQDEVMAYPSQVGGNSGANAHRSTSYQNALWHFPLILFAV